MHIVRRKTKGIRVLLLLTLTIASDLLKLTFSTTTSLYKKYGVFSKMDHEIAINFKNDLKTYLIKLPCYKNSFLHFCFLIIKEYFGVVAACDKFWQSEMVGQG